MRCWVFFPQPSLDVFVRDKAPESPRALSDFFTVWSSRRRLRCKCKNLTLDLYICIYTQNKHLYELYVAENVGSVHHADVFFFQVATRI